MSSHLYSKFRRRNNREFKVFWQRMRVERIVSILQLLLVGFRKGRVLDLRNLDGFW